MIAGPAAAPEFPGPEGALMALYHPAKEAGRLLLDASLTLATAESLTAGWISAAITMVPGSSGYYMGGICAYADAVKKAALGVSPGTLATWGAVSPQCSKEMARGARAAIGADVGLSSTGIAGPSGGSRQKPVGLVYLTCLDSTRSMTVELGLGGGRLAVTWRSAWEALALLRRFLAGEDGLGALGPA
jgi:PncC family amidohydrolase